jgi:hypothetical protein
MRRSDDEDSPFGYGVLNDLKIVGTILAYLGRSHHVTPLMPQCLGHFDPQALVQV